MITTTSNIAVKTVVAGSGNGQAKIGSLHSNGWAGFAQKDNFTDDDYAIIQDDTGITFVNAKETKYIGFRIGNVTKMHMTSDGNFGINRTNPQAKLHIYGNNTETQMFLGSEGTHNKAAVLKYFQGTTTTNSGAAGDGRLCISHWGDAVNSGQGLNIKKGGKVGIGTKDPESSLQVMGDIKCSGSFLYSSNTLSASSSTAPSGLFFATLSANSNNIEVSQTSGEKTTRNDTANPLPLRWNVATSNASSVSQWGRNNVGKGTIDLNTYDLIGRNVTTQSLNDGTCVHVKVTGIYEISFAIPVYSNKYRTNPCISVGIVTNPHTATNGTYNDTRMFASNGYIRADNGNNICMMVLSPIILQINENQGIQVYGRRIASWGRDERAKVKTNSTGVGYLFVKRIA